MHLTPLARQQSAKSARARCTKRASTAMAVPTRRDYVPCVASRSLTPRTTSRAPSEACPASFSRSAMGSMCQHGQNQHQNIRHRRNSSNAQRILQGAHVATAGSAQQALQLPQLWPQVLDSDASSPPGTESAWLHQRLHQRLQQQQQQQQQRRRQQPKRW